MVEDMRVRQVAEYAGQQIKQFYQLLYFCFPSSDVVKLVEWIDDAELSSQAFPVSLFFQFNLKLEDLTEIVYEIPESLSKAGWRVDLPAHADHEEDSIGLKPSGGWARQPE